MSALYKRIEELCKGNGMTITTMCKESGASRASLSDLKVGRKQNLSTDTLAKIARVLGVSVSFLLGEEPAWSAAVDRFGFCWETRYREEKKGNARAVVNDVTSSLDDRVGAQTDVFKALFSRSLEACGYSLDHPTFPTYIAMILHQGRGKHTVPDDVYEAMVKYYGTKSGIPKGTYYLVDNKKMPTLTEKDEHHGTISQLLRGWNDNSSSGTLPDNILPLPGMREWKVLGGTACGDPLYMDLDGETILAPDNIDADFVFRCVGDSMIGARILDGDVVFVKSCNVDNGQIAVVRIGEEYTLKRIYRGEDYLELRAENPAYPPKIIRGDQENAEIIGRAVHFLSRVI